MKREGQIVLFKFPQTDLSAGKLRPALLLRELPGSRNDWLVCMISSKTGQEIAGIDKILSINDEDFEATGLKSESVIRILRLAVVSEKLFSGAIGEVSQKRLDNVKANLVNWFAK